MSTFDELIYTTVAPGGEVLVGPHTYPVTGHTYYQFRFTVKSDAGYNLGLFALNEPRNDVAYPPYAYNVNYTHGGSAVFTSATLPVPTALDHVGWWVNYGSGTVGGTLDITFEIAWDNEAFTGGVCGYGTQPRPDVLNQTLIDNALIAAVVFALGWPEAAIALFAALVGLEVVAVDCSANPTVPPDVTDGDFIAGTFIPNPGGLGKLLAIFQYGLWSVYCECVPAVSPNPPPNPPTPLTPPTKVTGPGQPIIVCDNQNPCQTLNQIVQILTTLSININRPLFAGPSLSYAMGTRHANLSGDGQFSVSGILGLVAQLTVIPPRVGLEVGDPNRIWDVGWINVGTVDGWHTRAWISANPWMYFPVDMPNMTEVGYSIPADVRLDLVELVRAP
jgi:hypothetical protein